MNSASIESSLTGDQTRSKAGRRESDPDSRRSERFDFRLTPELEKDLGHLIAPGETDPEFFRRIILAGLSLLEEEPEKYADLKPERTRRGLINSRMRNTAVHFTPPEKERLDKQRQDGENNQQIIRRLLMLGARFSHAPAEEE